MSDDATPRLSIPYVAAGQAQKHVTVNTAFARLDGLVQAGVDSRTTTAQPASPDDGALYILPSGATGSAWASEEEGALMRFEAGAWARLEPAAGHLVWIKDEETLLVFDGDDWANPAFRAVTGALSPSGASTGLEIREEEVSVSGPTASTGIVIPARSIVLGVSTRTTLAVTGATSYGCGISGEATKFGGSLGISLGSSNIGIIGPTAFYSDTPVLLTADGSDFTGGKVKVAIHLLRFAAPV